MLNKRNETALQCHMKNQKISLEIIKFLVEKKTDIANKNENNDTLHIACENENSTKEIIKYLIEKE